MKKILTSLILVACLLCATMFGACGSKELKSISISKLPKTEYVIGEELDLTGGELTATYSDDSTETVSLTDSAVTIAKPNMRTTGEKNVSVTYNSVSTTFKITVSQAKLNVTFDLGHDGAKEVKEVEPNTAVSAIADPVRTGYVFLGWYVEAGASAKFNFGTSLTADTTIYAHWGYTVTFELGYTGAKNTVENVEIGATVARPSTIPEQEGHVFTDWYTTKACDAVFDFSKPINSNTTIYAGWQEVAADTEIYKVTFDYNDNFRKEEKRVIEGETVSAVADPAITGATFEGWYTDKEGTTKYDFATPVTADITLYAKWDINRYTAFFHINHANDSSIQEVTNIRVGATGTINSPEEPVLAGYYFAGWYTDAECTSEEAVFPIKNINEYHHFYAKWQKEWEFQAEYTDFDGKEAFGYSANGIGPSAFIMQNEAERWGAHNGYWVANMHNQGLYIEFVINSDREITDATLILRLSADFFDITLTPENYSISVNGEKVSYEPIELTGAISGADGGIMNKRPFTNHRVLTDLHLQKGENKIRFTAEDSHKYGEVGTINATAPMFDCIYINCNAELSWNPKTSNVA